MIRTMELAARAAELGMPAVAMTDHGNLFGASPSKPQLQLASLITKSSKP